MRLEVADLARMNPEALARGFVNLDAKTRQEAIGRFEASEAAFQRMNDTQRAAFANLLGAQTLERSVLQAQSFNRLTQSQQRAVWTNLGRQGQVAALRYTGLTADLARGNATQRDEQFERFIQQRASQ